MKKNNKGVELTLNTMVVAILVIVIIIVMVMFIRDGILRTKEGINKSDTVASEQNCEGFLNPGWKCMPECGYGYRDTNLDTVDCRGYKCCAPIDDQ